MVCTFARFQLGQHQAGGKGATLAQLYQKGFRVPNGFVVLPDSFEGDSLKQEAWEQVRACFRAMTKYAEGMEFAVRSSAMCEDSSSASFAGQFLTELGVQTFNQLLEAIHKVRKSRKSQEVRTYSEAQGLDTDNEMAVVVQQLVQADLSGVLFTADPITGSRGRQTGNFVHGLGEKLVSGQENAYNFTLSRSPGICKGTEYAGPPELKRYAGKLYRLGRKLEQVLGCPQDIEWSVAGGKLYLLQSRPITTLTGFRKDTGEWNDSLIGEFLWSNVNFGEAIPQVMTPLSWSVQQFVSSPYKTIPGYPSSGNIAGRPYVNLSIPASALYSMGKTRDQILQFLEGTLYTRIPEEMQIPVLTLSFSGKLSMISNLIRIQLRQRIALLNLEGYLKGNPPWCTQTLKQIQGINDKTELYSLWQHRIEPHLQKSIWTIMGTVADFTDYTMKLRRELTELVGPDDADKLISGLSRASDTGNSGLLASLGPVLGIARLAKGEMEREEYLAQYGHRGPNEFELSVPRPAEKVNWLEEQLEQFRKFPTDPEALLAKQRLRSDEAWSRFRQQYPAKARRMLRRVEGVGPRGHAREAARSEYVRDRWVARAFAVRAGQLTGLGDDIFLLTLEEVLGLLQGNETAVRYIPTRKEAHIKISA
ncbi:MAG TPA: PEP/pyruvate-binding domain-containing protein [Bacillota bacterium]|nr:PEP/pyruvate-binding domain-containing protein [Bacillota bacterium]